MEPPPLRSKRQQVVVACDKCRVRKTKCDGLRPVCSPCLSRGVSCAWSADPDANPITAIKRRNEQLLDELRDHQQLREMLVRGSTADVHRVVDAVRKGDDLSDIFEQARDEGVLSPADTLPSPSLSLASPGSAVPSRRRRSSAERLLYTMEPPESLPPLARRHSATLTHSHMPHPSLLPRPVDQRSALAGRADSHFMEIDSNPAPTAARPDTQLEHAHARDWEVTYVDDEAFRDILQSWFAWDHPSFTLFDKDTFLEDLATGKATDFCCPLLVHSIMALGCRNRHHRDADKADVIEHLAMARLLNIWDTARHETKPATVASAIIVFMCYALKGQDNTGYQYLAQAEHISGLLGLYRPFLQGDVYSESVNDKRTTLGLATIAWGQYNYRCYLSLINDILPMAGPPPVPIPALAYKAADTVKWVGWPHNDIIRLSFATSLLEARCSLSTIVEAIMPMHRAFETDPFTASYLSSALDLWNRLNAWFTTLNGVLKYGIDNGSPQLLGLHNYFYLAVLELFRPFVLPSGTIVPTLALLTTAGHEWPLPLMSYRASYDHLRSLMSSFDRQYPPACPTPPQNFAPLVHICVDSMSTAMDDEGARFYLEMALVICSRMSAAFTVYKFIIRAVKGIAQRHKVTLPDTVRGIIASKMADAQKYPASLEPVKSTLVVDASMKYRDHNHYSLEIVLKKLEAVQVRDAG